MGYRISSFFLEAVLEISYEFTQHGTPAPPLVVGPPCPHWQWLRPASLARAAADSDVDPPPAGLKLRTDPQVAARNAGHRGPLARRRSSLLGATGGGNLAMGSDRGMGPEDGQSCADGRSVLHIPTETVGPHIEDRASERGSIHLLSGHGHLIATEQGTF